MIYPYPPVADEFATVKELLRGRSIARIGDGELKLIHGRHAMREPANEKLARELRDVLQRPTRDLCVGIPTLDPRGPKHANWLRHAVDFCRVLVPEVRYFSAFITRPDSAPWIETAEFARDVRRLWTGRRIALLCEESSAIYRTVTRQPDGPASVLHLACPHRETYARISEFEKAIRAAEIDVAILSAGPAATCLAARLCAAGVQAIDIGSAGRFLARNLWPNEPPDDAC